MSYWIKYLIIYSNEVVLNFYIANPFPLIFCVVCARAWVTSRFTLPAALRCAGVRPTWVLWPFGTCLIGRLQCTIVYHTPALCSLVLLISSLFYNKPSLKRYVVIVLHFGRREFCYCTHCLSISDEQIESIFYLCICCMSCTKHCNSPDFKDLLW